MVGCNGVQSIESSSIWEVDGGGTDETRDGRPKIGLVEARTGFEERERVARNSGSAELRRLVEMVGVARLLGVVERKPKDL